MNIEQPNIQPLLASLQAVPGFDAAAFVQAHEPQHLLTSIRLNPAKPCPGLLESFNTPLSPVPWNSQGHYLAQRPLFTLDPLLHAGAYYVQEASSLFLRQAVEQCCPAHPLRALDLCAAPGGKSTLLQSVLHPGSLLVSNEVIKSRTAVLSENITKWGAANMVVSNNDPQHFGRLPGFFDLMVVDAPCSGSGLFRREPAALNEWSLANVELCSQRQQRILAQALPALRCGGLLVYSTCSYSVAENEAILDWLVQQGGWESKRLTLQPNWGIVETMSSGAYGYRFFPHLAKGEGFFIACLQKTSPTAGQLPKGKKQEQPNREAAAQAAEWLREPHQWGLLQQTDGLLALPTTALHDLSILQAALYLKKAGIRLGKPTPGGLAPDHELAMSHLLRHDLPGIELDKDAALQYLRRREMDLALPHGWCLMRHRALPLGWAKGLGNRVNNYYPKEWRILMDG